MRGLLEKLDFMRPGSFATGVAVKVEGAGLTDMMNQRSRAAREAFIKSQAGEQVRAAAPDGIRAASPFAHR